MGSCNSTSEPTAQTPRVVASPKADRPTFKLLVVGDPQVGKTSLITRIGHDKFSRGVKQTKAAVTSHFEYELSDKTIPVGLTLVDIPAHLSIANRKVHYRDLDGAIVVVDVSDQISIELCNSYKRDILANARSSVNSSLRNQSSSSRNQNRPSNQNEDRHHKMSVNSLSDSSTDLSEVEFEDDTQKPHIPVLLIGNKSDLLSDDAEIKPEEIFHANIEELNRLSEQYSFFRCIPVSAKTNSDMHIHKAIESFLRYLTQMRAAKTLENSQPNTGKRPLPKPSSQNILSAGNLNAVSERETTTSARTSERDVLKSVGSPSNISTTESNQNKTAHAGKPSSSLQLHVSFTLTGVKTMDGLLRDAEPLVATVTEARVKLDKGKVKFSEACRRSGIIRAEGASVLECLGCIKDQTAFLASVTLVKDGHFTQIVLHPLEDQDLSPHFQQCLSVFNSHVGSVCRDVSRDFGGVDQQLMEAEEKLAKATRNLTSLALLGEKSPQEVKALQATAEQNQHIIFATQQMAREVAREAREIHAGIRDTFGTN